LALSSGGAGSGAGCCSAAIGGAAAVGDAPRGSAFTGEAKRARSCWSSAHAASGSKVKGFVAAAAEEDEEAEAGDEGGGHGVPAAKGEEKSRAPAAAEGLDGTRRAR